MASGGVTLSRLTQERKNWRENHPFGFVAKPESKPDGSVDFLTWKCLIPGKADTDWAGGLYPLTLKFTEDFPAKPPLCYFPQGFFHPNVYDSGRVCLSIINDDELGTWKPSITVRQILEGIQALLNDPNVEDSAQALSYEIYGHNQAKYKEILRKQAKKYAAQGIA